MDMFQEEIKSSFIAFGLFFFNQGFFLDIPFSEEKKDILFSLHFSSWDSLSQNEDIIADKNNNCGGKM